MKTRSWVAALAGAAIVSLALSGTARAAILADIVWVVDTSGSMSGDINQVKQRIEEFDTAMTTNGIDARYGLVRFGGAASLIQNITDYSTFVAAGSPFQLLTANGGGTEDGSAAIEVALGASFRANTVRNIILVTDEDDDSPGNRNSLTLALNSTSANELINIIGNPNDDSNDYYQGLAAANGGQFFDILSFRADPATFFTNFVNTKVREIIDESSVPEPASLALIATGLFAAGFGTRRRAKA